jgi:conjugative transfer region protein (TIGR03750 family)
MDLPGMKGREIDFIPDRLIDEPVVFRGLTDTEVVTITLVSIVLWVPVMTLILGVFGKALFGVGGGFAMAILTLLLVGKRFQIIKRRMPDGLHIVYLKKLAQKKIFFINYGYIETTQSWDIRRNVEIQKIQPELKD